MDRLAPTISSPRRRRRYSGEFKARVIKACDELRVTRYLDELAEHHGLPIVIVRDNGPEFTSKA